MRKFIITTAFVLISATAQAGQTRGLIVASAEPTQSTVAQQLKAIETEAPKQEAKLETKTETKAAPQVQAEVKSEAKSETKPQPKADKPVAKKRETDEQKARRIAARYGISW